MSPFARPRIWGSFWLPSAAAAVLTWNGLRNSVGVGMFLLAARWGGSLANLAGAATSSPLAAGLFILLALSLIGVPPLSGFWAKLLVLVELSRQAQPLYYLGAFAILGGAALEANYLFRVASRFYHPDSEGAAPATHSMPNLATASLLSAGLVASVFVLTPLAEQIEAIATQAADTRHYI